MTACWKITSTPWASSINFEFSFQLLRRINFLHFSKKMCRGSEKDQSHSSPSLCITKKEDDDSVNCELCTAKATLYCQADDAFLCRKCDSWVHGANFLAQRHIRCLLCRTCRRLTQRYLIGTSAEVILPAVVRLKENSHCDSKIVDIKDSKSVKQPFLFLWFSFFKFNFLSSFRVFMKVCSFIGFGIVYIC